MNTYNNKIEKLHMIQQTITNIKWQQEVISIEWVSGIGEIFEVIKSVYENRNIEWLDQSEKHNLWSTIEHSEGIT